MRSSLRVSRDFCGLEPSSGTVLLNFGLSFSFLRRCGPLRGWGELTDARLKLLCRNRMPFLDQSLFRCDVSAFFDDGAFHKENQKGEHDPDHGKDQESVEISEGRGLILAQILQGLPSHLLCPSWIAGLLEVAGRNLRDVRI